MGGTLGGIKLATLPNRSAASYDLPGGSAMRRTITSGDTKTLLPGFLLLAGFTLTAAGLACSPLGLGGGSTADYSALLDGPANPLSIAAEIDPAHASSSAISTSGGTVETTAADGTRYTLSIPEGALILEHEITLTPVREVADLPLRSLGGAVVIEPAGLHFYKLATLTIEPAEKILLAEQVTFGFGEAGGDFHLQPLAIDPEAIQILVLGSGGFGVGGADRPALLELLPTSPGDRFAHLLGDIFLRGREQGSTESMAADVKALFAAYSASLVERLEAGAGSTQGPPVDRGELHLAVSRPGAGAGRPPAATASSCEDARELFDLGVYEKYTVELGVTDGEGLDTPSDALALQLAEACLAEAHAACVADHNLARLPEEYLGLWYLGELGLVSDSAVAQITTIGRGFMERCYQFDLEVISIITLNEEGIGGFESVMTSRVPLRLVGLDLPDDVAFSELEVAGAAPLVNESMTWKVAPGGCDITGIPGGTDIEVLKLPLILSGTGLGEVNLSYRTGDSTEGGTVQCPQASTADVPTGGYWSNSYFALHLDEISMTPGAGGVPDPLSGGMPPFVARDWDFLGGQDLARKEYVRSQDQLSEDTTFLLIHTPQ
jgi:hypothetical protein